MFDEPLLDPFETLSDSAFSRIPDEFIATSLRTAKESASL